LTLVLIMDVILIVKLCSISFSNELLIMIILATFSGWRNINMGGILSLSGKDYCYYT
jgi:hypothetical protein